MPKGRSVCEVLEGVCGEEMSVGRRRVWASLHLHSLPGCGAVRHCVGIFPSRDVHGQPDWLLSHGTLVPASLEAGWRGGVSASPKRGAVNKECKTKGWTASIQKEQSGLQIAGCVERRRRDERESGQKQTVGRRFFARRLVCA